MKRSYSTDLSDTEWECLEPHVPPPNERGRPRVHTTRQILDAILGYKMAELVAEGTVSDWYATR
jgi:transposase